MRKVTILKGHTPENNYDGYDPHRHWEVLDMPVTEYMSSVNALGLVFPPASMADLIISPWDIPWIRDNVKLVGYNYREFVNPWHFGLYAFDVYHDGVDGQHDLTGAPGVYKGTVMSSYYNAHQKHASADIFEYDLEEPGDLIYVPTIDIVTEVKPTMPTTPITEFDAWQRSMGIESIDALHAAGVLAEPDRWKDSLGQPMPQWLFWVMLVRIMNAKGTK